MKALEQKVVSAADGATATLWTARPETASRVRGRIESVLDWAAARNYRQGENPARWRGHLENLLPKRSKVRAVEHMLRYLIPISRISWSTCAGRKASQLAR